jgi:hypothetical protein
VRAAVDPSREARRQTYQRDLEHAHRLRRSSFSGDNPVGRVGVQKDSLEPEQPRRDLQIATLFTGMRTENVTKTRWELSTGIAAACTSRARRPRHSRSRSRRR